MPALKRSPLPTADPAVCIARPRLPTRAQLVPYLDRIDEARRYANFGPLVAELEARLAARMARPSCVATVANGTLALTLALKAAGARPGALCAMPAWTFVASAHAALDAGLVPWFLDVDPATWMLDPDAVVGALARAPGKVGAILPVAAFGRAPDLAPWRRVADATGLPVIVDGAAAFDGLKDAPVPVTVSLHATKTVAAGEGGYVVSHDADFIGRVRELSAFGFNGDRTARRPAVNGKMSEYAAAVALASLDAWPSDRMRFAIAACRLRIALAMTPDILFQPGWGLDWISSICVVGTPAGGAPALAEALAQDGIETREWWGAGCHLHPAFAGCPAEPLPVTQHLAASTLGLPYFIDIDEAATGRIVSALLQALRSSHG
jgi:dTDP-4-amino-4,6-dideoxygalactose transaminase